MKLRLKKLKKIMREEKLDAVLISSIPNIIYLTDFNHFDASEREAFLLLTQKNSYILTDKRYSHAVKTHVTEFILCEIAHGHSVSDWLKTLAEKERIKTLGIEETNLTIAEEKKIPDEIITTHFDLQAVRMIKSSQEIAAIKKACAIGDQAFEHIIKQIKIGMTEKEVALLLEIFIKKQHAELSFNTIVAFGENAAFIHHKTGDKKLTPNSPILIDFGVRFANYCSDMSRTIFFGNATSAQRKAYMTVFQAQQQAIAFIEKNLSENTDIYLSAVDNIAREYILQQGYESIPHSLGHGIGLEVHEEPRLSPSSQQLLQSGMVFSIEPGIYLPHKFGIRIEDIFAIEGNELTKLTKSSHSLIEI